MGRHTSLPPTLATVAGKARLPGDLGTVVFSFRVGNDTEVGKLGFKMLLCGRDSGVQGCLLHWLSHNLILQSRAKKQLMFIAVFRPPPETDSAPGPKNCPPSPNGRGHPSALIHPLYWTSVTFWLTNITFMSG
jgi:hypothetical protein